MAKNPERRRKAEERRRKRRQREQRKHAATQTELRSLGGRLAWAARGPLYDCRLARAADDPRKPQVLLAREGPGGITAVLYLVDLGCLGLKGSAVQEELTPGEYDELVEFLGRELDVAACEPERARKLVESAVRHADGLGFPARAEPAAALAFFGEVDASRCAEVFECGVGGMPFYEPGPDDDVPEVLRRLEERLGPQGFRYLLLPEEVERDARLPGEDDPDPLTQAWVRLRRAQLWLMDLLGSVAGTRFDERFPSRAWLEFAGEREYEGLEESVGDAFEAWMLTRAIPGCVPRGRPVRAEEERSALDVLLAENGARLSALEVRLLEELRVRPFSFHVVRAVEPGKGMRLEDLFTGRESAVRAPEVSAELFEGGLVFARVLELDGVAFLAGMAGGVLAPSSRFHFLKVRDVLRRELGELDERKLLGVEGLLRDECCRIAFEDRLPVEEWNADGDVAHFHELEYELACPPREALEALRPLAEGWTDADFEREAEPDARGELARIEIPWQGRGRHWRAGEPLLVFGYLGIDGARLTASVNSAARAERVKARLAVLLGARAKLRDVQAMTTEELLARGARGSPGGRLLPRAAPELAPEAARELSRTHWVAWLDRPVPVLGGLSPRAAAQDPSGRELLEVLLDDYALAGEPGDPFKPDVSALRRELGV